jgi:hypothetical protein
MLTYSTCTDSAAHTHPYTTNGTPNTLCTWYIIQNHVAIYIRMRSMHGTRSAPGRSSYQTNERGKAEVEIEIEIVDKINLCHYFHNNLIFKLLL